MTRIGFVIIGLGAVLIGIRLFGMLDSEMLEVVAVIAAVAGALAIAIDAERGEESARAEKAPKPDVSLGGGGRFGPVTGIGFLLMAVGFAVIATRLVGVVDTELADIGSVGAIVAGAVTVAIDGEREIGEG